MQQVGFVGALSREERDDLVRKLHGQQGGRCFISGEPIDLSQHEVELDHITALARGGPDNEANLALVLAHHNRSKGIRDLELQRRLFAFSRDLQQYEKSNPKNPLFTVGHVLAKVCGDGRQVSLSWLNESTVRLAWTTAAEKPRTLDVPLVEDCAAYLSKYAPHLQYDRSLAAGFPIASGVIEGACRYLVRDRMESPVPAGAWTGRRPSSACARFVRAVTLTRTGSSTRLRSTRGTTHGTTLMGSCHRPETLRHVLNPHASSS